MKNRLSCFAVGTVSLFLMVGATGCDQLPPDIKDRISGAVDTLLGRSTQEKSDTQGDGKGSAEDAKKAELAKRNAQLLNEMIHVITMKPPADKGLFGSLVDSLNQGASFEGMYNGMVYSRDYRKLEHSHTSATPTAVQVFAREMAAVAMELPSPPKFTATEAKPLEAPQRPTGYENEEEPGELVFGEEKEDAVARAVRDFNPDQGKLEAEYAEVFKDSSIFTMKRVLGTEVLRMVDLKLKDRKKLADWYSAWVVHMLEHKVDFGLDLRNRSEAEFHQKWAMNVDGDVLKWEILNRLHRVLNAANGGEPGGPGSAGNPETTAETSPAES